MSHVGGKIYGVEIRAVSWTGDNLYAIFDHRARSVGADRFRIGLFNFRRESVAGIDKGETRRLSVTEPGQDQRRKRERNKPKGPDRGGDVCAFHFGDLANGNRIRCDRRIHGRHFTDRGVLIDFSRDRARPGHVD